MPVVFNTIWRRLYRAGWNTDRPISPGPLRYVFFVFGGITASYLVAMAVSSEKEKAPKKHLYQRKSDSSLLAWLEKRRESEKTVYSLVAINAFIFALWRIPRFEATLARYFTHGIRSHPISMLLSTYSHQSLWHFAANMLALTSFGTFIHEKMGREQFLAFYTSCGLLSSGTSHIAKALRRDYSKSLGASGALFGLAAGCAHYPDLKVSIVFLPFVSAPISLALPAFMLYDLAGLIKGWASFDHAAHLGGAVNGYLLFALSKNHIWPRRKMILSHLGYFRLFPK